MKKILSLLLIFIFLLQPVAIASEYTTAESAELLNLTPGIPVPYDKTYMLCFYKTFQAYSMREVYRLMELCELSYKDHFYLYVPAEIEAETIEFINNFALENKDNFWEHNFTTYCEKHDDYLSVQLPWKKDMKNSLPILKNADDVYNAVKESKTHPTYAKPYKVDRNYFTPEWSGDETILDKISADVYEKYGEDISSYISAMQIDHSSSSGYTSYIGIGLTDQYKQLEHNMYERYFRVLKNDTILPIEDDMSDVDKLKIITHSLGLIMPKYAAVGSPYNKPNQVIGAYSTGYGVCEDYALLFYYMCYVQGIEAKYVVGDSPMGGHAYNAVKCDGKWYMVEPQHFKRHLQNLQTSDYRIQERIFTPDNLSLNFYIAKKCLDGWAMIGMTWVLRFQMKI